MFFLFPIFVPPIPPLPDKPAAVVPAEKPTTRALYVADVDLIIVNRVRTSTIDFDRHGRPIIKTSEMWWVSFWSRPAYSPFAGSYWPCAPWLMVDRGWRSLSGVRAFGRTSDGFYAECRDGCLITAPAILMIDSPFDVEMKWGAVNQPIRVP